MAADPVTEFELEPSLPARSAISIKAVVTALVMAAWVAFWPAYTSLVLHCTRADHSHLSIAMLIPYVFLLVINTRLERWGFGYSPSELLTVCCVGLVAVCTQGEWLVVWLLEMLTMPHYFASPENRFEELLLPYIPPWATITDRNVAAGFFEGLPPGTPFPRMAWLVPLAWWGLFLGSVLCINLCLSVLLRKQWMEHEKLAFPVGLPVFPFLSGRYGRNVIQIGVGYPPIITTFVLMRFTLGYFTKLEVLFSMWFFHALAIVQIGIFNRFGVEMGKTDPYSSSRPAMGWQTFGGMVVFVFWGFWTARHHFRAIYRKAFHKDESVDDSDELMGYRTALFLLIFSGLFMILWLHLAWMRLDAVLAFCFGTLVIYLGLARILVESGLVYLRVPITAQAFTWHTFGIPGLGPAGAGVLTLTMGMIADGKTFAIT